MTHGCPKTTKTIETFLTFEDSNLVSKARVVALSPQASLLLPAAPAADLETPVLPAKVVPERLPKSSAIDLTVKTFDCLLEQPVEMFAR